MSEDRKGPLAWFAANHVAANILMLFILVAGGLSLASVVVETFPEFDAGMITVRVPYRGASPAEAEEGVCVRVEEAIASIEGIKRIRSTAQENLGLVTVELEEDADNRKVLDDVKAAVDRIETFPLETEKAGCRRSRNPTPSDHDRALRRSIRESPEELWPSESVTN